MITPFLISPKGERMVSLLPPWGKVGKGVNILEVSELHNGSKSFIE